MNERNQTLRKHNTQQQQRQRRLLGAKMANGDASFWLLRFLAVADAFLK